MKKRSSRKQKQVESQITATIIVSGLFIFHWTNSINKTAIVLAFLMCIIVSALILIRYRQNLILKKSGIKEIDRMDGVRFENYLKELYKSMGYSVKTTKISGDFGADLVLIKDNKRIVVQAKRYKNNVGVKAIQEVNSARSHYNAVESWVVTNSYFTKAAITLAASNQVKLIDRDQLIQNILSQKNVGLKQKACEP